jgi:hypothetical protein
MGPPFEAELNQVRTVDTGGRAEDVVVHWQSAYGLILIEVRNGQAYVNGDLVERVTELAIDSSASQPAQPSRRTRVRRLRYEKL